MTNLKLSQKLESLVPGETTQSNLITVCNILLWALGRVVKNPGLKKHLVFLF